MAAIRGLQGLISSRLSRVSVNPGALGELLLSLLNPVLLKALNLRRKTLNGRRISSHKKGVRPRQKLRRAAPNTGHQINFLIKNFIKNALDAKRPPEGPVKEVWAQVGRGGGKTRAAAAALVATAIRAYPSLAPGERAKAFLLAQNRGTARQGFQLRQGNFKFQQTAKTNDSLRNEEHNFIKQRNRHRDDYREL